MPHTIISPRTSLVNALMLLLAIISVGFAPQAHAAPAYAGFVMDADTGKVLYQKNANAQRYPASLTKMMTLYLTFDALRTGKVTKSTRMRASSYAAKQPQTNISLKAGDRITVDQAIRALVVRSANDVAVVLAEKLGGSERRFAQMMTDKARQLGMRSTTFKNPHGLPDRRQVTTAKDMAQLGAALRRDFPQYYDYFKNKTFSYKGKTFKGHNKVLDQFPGVDGIKTGYIRSSGFNLVSSVKRDGYHVVAVVIGGKTSTSRNAQMVSLLSSAITDLEAERRPRFFAGVPVPDFKRNTVAVKKAIAKMEATKLAEAKAKAAAEAKAEEQRIATLPKPKPDNTLALALAATSKNKTPHTLGATVPSKAITPSSDGAWGIQIGAFRNEATALTAAATAVKLARDVLGASHVAISDSGSQTKSIHRARLANLSESQARMACEKLQEANKSCFVFRARNSL